MCVCVCVPTFYAGNADATNPAATTESEADLYAEATTALWSLHVVASKADGDARVLSVLMTGMIDVKMHMDTKFTEDDSTGAQRSTQCSTHNRKTASYNTVAAACTSLAGAPHAHANCVLACVVLHLHARADA